MLHFKMYLLFRHLMSFYAKVNVKYFIKRNLTAAIFSVAVKLNKNNKKRKKLN